MNLSNIMQVQEPSVRKLLFEDWVQNEAWKRKMERRFDELEQKLSSKQVVGFHMEGGEHTLETAFINKRHNIPD
jgi:hypothetical protein